MPITRRATKRRCGHANKLLADGKMPPITWLGALEAQMAEHGREVIAEARAADRGRPRGAPGIGSPDDFRARPIALDGLAEGDLAAQLRVNRGRDAAAGRTTRTGRTGRILWSCTAPRRDAPHAQSSTGEQKALLLGLVLAHAELVARPARRAAAPAARRGRRSPRPAPRAALFARLEGRGQVWMTATEARLVRRHRPTPPASRRARANRARSDARARNARTRRA